MIPGIKEAFDKINAEDELKARTRAFLAKKTNNYTEYRVPNVQRLAAAAACFLCLLAGSYWLYFVPTAEISIDINPSIELGINRFDQVISVRGRNDDGKELASSLHLRFTNYTEAIHRTLESQKIITLLSNNEMVTIAVVGSDEARCAKMLSNIKSCTAGQENTYCCYLTHSDEVAAAHEMGLSYGKYSAFLELQSLAPDMTPEEIQDMSMREIRSRINALSPADERVAQADSGKGCGHHNAGQSYRHRAGWWNAASSDE